MRRLLPSEVGRSAAARLFASLLAVAAAGASCASRKGSEGGAESNDESPADRHYDVAVGSFHNGMYEDAKMQVQKALTADPQHADAHYLQGLLRLNEGKTIVDAIEIERCLRDEAAQFQRSRAEDLHREARASFMRAVEFYPEGAAGRGRAYNSLAVISLFFHEYEQAAAEAKAALAEQFYTDRFSALSNLGWAHYRRGDLVSATADLRQAVLMNPDFCVAHYRLAQVYLESEQPEQALEHAVKVTQDSRCPIQEAFRIAAAAYLRAGRADEASAALDKCIELAPRSCLADDCRRLQGGSMQ